MCGRYASFREAQALADEFEIQVIDPVAAELPPSWNIAPTQAVRVVLERYADGAGGRVDDADAVDEAGELRAGVAISRQLHVARWGLVPHWAKDPSVGSRMINARSETAAEKPSFRHSVARRRCLVTADAYYEWRKPAEGSGRTAKTPFAIGRDDDAPIAFAGLYSWWRDPRAADGAGAGPGGTGTSRGTEVVLGAHDGWLLTCSILTRASDGPMRGIHDRVPVILETDDVDAWLDPRQTDAAAAMAVAARETPDLRWYEVSRSVNTPRNNSPDPLEPVPDGETGHS